MPESIGDLVGGLEFALAIEFDAALGAGEDFTGRGGGIGSANLHTEFGELAIAGGASVTRDWMSRCAAAAKSREHRGGAETGDGETSGG
ncbi:unannotated protein [freshwater metagenome]|uniref:Unannotated protein n=1 Tax=freshwater metagenome TaxID=449393 RepID=A0A6J6MXH9_9ZZZZ